MWDSTVWARIQSSQGGCQRDCISRHLCNWKLLNPAVLVVLPSAPYIGGAVQNSPGGSGSGSFRNSCAENFAYKSVQGHIVTMPHMNSANDNRISGAPEAIWAYRYQFQVCTRSIKPNLRASKCIWLGCLCTQILQMDISRDLKFGLGLTSPRQFRTLVRRVKRNYTRRWQRVERNTLHTYIWGQILASLRSVIISHFWTRALRGSNLNNGQSIKGCPPHTPHFCTLDTHWYRHALCGIGMPWV